MKRHMWHFSKDTDGRIYRCYTYHDIISSVSRIQFCKMIRHAVAENLYGSNFIASVDKEDFSMENLTKIYYSLKKDLDKSLIGRSIAYINLQVKDETYLVSLHISFENINGKAAAIVKYFYTYCDELSLDKEYKDIRTNSLDEMYTELEKLYTAQQAQMKHLTKVMKEKHHTTSSKKKLSNKAMAILEKAPTYSMKELETM